MIDRAFLKAKFAGALLLGLGLHPAFAGSMQVAPVLVDTANQQTATLTLRNPGDYPLNAQVRVYRWTQESGADKLEPTDEVVASPPLIALRPRTDYVVRLVHAGGLPERGEKSFRVLIDELPSPRDRVNGVALLIRQSIPVFFSGAARGPAQVQWRIEQKDGKSVLVGSNSGERRLRLADVNLKDEGGGSLSLGKGLRGYVLSHSSVRWPLPPAQEGRLRGRIFVNAATEGALIHVPLGTAAPR